jgi:hypothetical protein
VSDVLQCEQLSGNWKRYTVGVAKFMNELCNMLFVLGTRGHNAHNCVMMTRYVKYVICYIILVNITERVFFLSTLMFVTNDTFLFLSIIESGGKIPIAL